MLLYSLFFDECVSQQERHEIAARFESMGWEVDKRFKAADPFSGRLNVTSLGIVSWDSNSLLIPALPSSCRLEKLGES